MVLQIRREQPRAGQRDPYYAPERDIAHLGPGLLRAAMSAMDEQWLEPWFQDFMATYHVGENDFGEGAKMLAQALQQILQAKDPVEALEAAGFTKLEPPVQMGLYTKMGQVLLAAIWSGMKDVHQANDAPPVSIEQILHEDVEIIMRHFAALQEERELSDD